MSETMLKGSYVENIFDRTNEVIPRNKNTKSTLSSVAISLDVVGRTDNNHLRTKMKGSSLYSSKIM